MTFGNNQSVGSVHNPSLHLLLIALIPFSSREGGKRQGHVVQLSRMLSGLHHSLGSHPVLESKEKSRFLEERNDLNRLLSVISF